MSEIRPIKTASGYFCGTPIVFEYQGEAFSRPCGRCLRCLAVKKRDLTGRAAAEAVRSDEMVTFTLTYRPGEPGAFKWQVRDRQNFIKRLRKHLWDDARRFVGAPVRYQRKVDSDGIPWKQRISAAATTARYFGCGETGEKRTRRHHWHVVVLFKHGAAGGSGFVSSKRDANLRWIPEIHPIWPHGLVTIDACFSDLSDRIRAVRYVSKYVSKAALAYKDKEQGREPSAVLFRSLKPALGAEYLAEWAERHAKAGLPLPSQYEVPHVRFSRGRRDAVKHVLGGVSRATVIRKYRDEWVRLRPDKDIPWSAFLERHDERHVMKRTGHNGSLGVMPRAVVPPLPPKRDDCEGWLVVSRGALVLGVVQTLYTGVAFWGPTDGKLVILDRPTLRGLVDLADADHLKVESFIEGRRGPNWLSPRDRFELAEDRRCGLLQALIDGLPIGDMLEIGTHSKRAVTGLVRKLRLVGQVGPDFKPIRRQYKPPKDAARYLDRQDRERFKDRWDDEPPKPPLVWVRPFGNSDFAWENMPRTLRKIP